jgi:hypothetical protein
MPAALAMVRVLQCVSPLGVVSRVLTITASTASSDTVRGAPTRGSSYSPASRRVLNRTRHLATVVLVVRRWRATALSVVLSATASTSRARKATARLTCARLVKRVSSVRSLSVITTSVLGRPRFAMAPIRSHYGHFS